MVNDIFGERIMVLKELDKIAKDLGYKHYDRYKARTSFVFKDIPLKGKKVLEIGCGSGAFCIWSALNGADHVLGIEPESDGHIDGSLGRFRDLIGKYEIPNVVVKDCFFQDLDVPEEKFDIVLMINVINHLDEEACEKLHYDEDAKKKYISLLSHLGDFLKSGSVIIIADCGRTNFWNYLNMKSPFAPTIEWDKHQNPQTWIQLFGKAGYNLLDSRWSTLYPLGSISSNWLMNFFTKSHFTTRFIKK